jgi:hypothetical protein
MISSQIDEGVLLIQERKKKGVGGGGKGRKGEGGKRRRMRRRGRGEREGGDRYLQGFDLEKWEKMDLPFPEMRQPVKRAGFLGRGRKEVIRSLVLDILGF